MKIAIYGHHLQIDLETANHKKVFGDFYYILLPENPTTLNVTHDLHSRENQIMQRYSAAISIADIEQYEHRFQDNGIECLILTVENLKNFRVIKSNVIYKILRKLQLDDAVIPDCEITPIHATRIAKLNTIPAIWRGELVSEYETSTTVLLLHFWYEGSSSYFGSNPRGWTISPPIRVQIYREEKSNNIHISFSYPKTEDDKVLASLTGLESYIVEVPPEDDAATALTYIKFSKNLPWGQIYISVATEDQATLLPKIIQSINRFLFNVQAPLPLEYIDLINKKLRLPMEVPSLQMLCTMFAKKHRVTDSTDEAISHVLKQFD